MAQWRVSTKQSKCIEEREIWTHPDKGVIERRTGFRNGSYLVTTDDIEPPEFELSEGPDGDGSAHSVDMNSCGYDTELIGLSDGYYLNIKWSNDLSEIEKEELEAAWEEDFYDGWENLGWMLDDTEVWFLGDLDIELIDAQHDDELDDDSIERIAIEEGLTEWFPAKIKPVRNGYYDIEEVVVRVWPYSPIHRAEWNGHAWVDENQNKLEIKCWRGLLKI